MAAPQYPKHPRPVITKVDAEAKRAIAKACALQLSQKPLTSYSPSQGQRVSLAEVFRVAFGEQLWYLHHYATELCEWEIGVRSRRPWSGRVKMDGQHFIDFADQAYRLFCHWTAVVEAAKARGATATQSWANRGDYFGSYPAALVDELNAQPLSEGVQLSQGGAEQNKRAPEEIPELTPVFDDELAKSLIAACAAQRLKPIHDGRTVNDCLYFPLRDVFGHLLSPFADVEYALNRVKWLAGGRPRRPQWHATANAAKMTEIDQLCERLARHWLALHAALSADGTVEVDQAHQLLFADAERLLLTDVESISDRTNFEAQHEAREAYRAVLKSARTRPSALAERRVA